MEFWFDLRRWSIDSLHDGATSVFWKALMGKENGKLISFFFFFFWPPYSGTRDFFYIIFQFLID